MGWNDSGIVDALSIKKSIAFVAASLFLLGIFFVPVASAQSDSDKEKVMTYKVDYWFPPTVRNHYSYTEKSDITRTYSDGSVMTFSREIVFFFDMKAPNQKNEGFTDMDVSIDSAHYKYTKADYTYSYNTQGEAPGNFNILDFMATIAPLAKFYTMTYSPYGNISKLEGEALQIFRNKLVERKDSYNQIDHYIWTEGTSNARLIHISDVKKIDYPNYRIAEDSTFLSPLFLQINHIDLQDTVEMTLDEVSSGYMYFSGDIEDVEYFTKKARFEGIEDQLLEIADVKANGKIFTELSPRGTPEKTEIELNMEVKAKIKRDSFTEQVKTKLIWELLGQWEY